MTTINAAFWDRNDVTADEYLTEVMNPRTQKYKRKEMSDLEIDRALALAIGYREEDVRVNKDFGFMVFREGYWQIFSHKASHVAWPIAVKYNCFPLFAQAIAQWFAFIGAGPVAYADTPERAVALAVIRGAR